MDRKLFVAFTTLLFMAMSGCSKAPTGTPYSAPATPSKSKIPVMTGYGFPGADKVQFKDDVKPKGDSPSGLSDITFTEVDGQQKKLSDYISDDVNNVVLVVTRGYGSYVCLYCATQTSRLIANYDKFKERNTEVVVTFPVSKKEDSGKVSELADKAIEFTDAKPESVPFSILLDVELNAVNQLGIKDALAKPATYIIDRNGDVRFAYVGSSITDRPSIKSLLTQVDSLNAENPKPTQKKEDEAPSDNEADANTDAQKDEAEAPKKTKTESKPKEG